MKAPPRPSSRCRTLLLELSRYLDDDLPPARRRAVERHIETCGCCGTMAASLRRTVAACRAAAKTRPPPDVMLRAAERIRALVGRKVGRPVVDARRRRRTSGPAQR